MSAFRRQVHSIVSSTREPAVAMFLRHSREVIFSVAGEKAVMSERAAYTPTNNPQLECTRVGVIPRATVEDDNYDTGSVVLY